MGMAVVTVEWECTVALKKNVFTPDFEKFREVMADMSHYLMFVGWRLGEANKSVERSLAVLEKMGHKNKFGAFNRLTMVNVFHPSNAPMRAPCGNRGTEGESIVPMTQEMEGRFHSYMLVAGFERLESYLKALHGHTHYQLRGQITLPSKRAFHKAQAKNAKQEGTAPYYVAYAKYACRRNCNEAMEVFQKVLPWDTMVFHLMHLMPFEEIVALLGYCRHCIVHDEGRVPDDIWESLNVNQVTFVRSCLRESILTGEETILPDKRKIELIVQMLVSYGYGLYILLSEKCGMEIEKKYFRRPGDPKTKRSGPPTKKVTIHLGSTDK